MRYLITRPQTRAEAFAADLRARGYEAVITPLQHLHLCEGMPVETKGVAAMAVSSVSAVAALEVRGIDNRTIPVFAVGPQTAEAARAAGFVAVVSADGDRFALAAQIARAVPTGSRILHATAKGGHDLPLDGYAVTKLALYEMLAETHLPDHALIALQSGTLDGVFGFSPKGAEIFRDCLLQSGLEGVCGRLVAYCISPATAFFWENLGFAQICIAKAPHRAAMLDMLPKASA